MCFESEDCDPVLVSLLVLDAVVLGLVVVVNCSLAVAMLRRRRALFAARPATRFALSMSFADLAVAAAGCYYRSFEYACPVRRALSRSKGACVSRFALMVLAYLASSHSLVLLALDRYCAVVHALRYHQIINHWRSSLMVAGAWVLAAAIAAALFLWNHWAPQQPCEEQFVVPPWYIGLVAAISHCLVFSVIAATHFKIHLLATSKSNARPPLRTPSAQVLILLTSCYVTCWTPFLLVLAARQVLHVYDESMERLFQATWTFASLNYVFNSFIFSWKNRLLREAVLELFRCRRGLKHVAKPLAAPIILMETVI